MHGKSDERGEKLGQENAVDRLLGEIFNAQKDGRNLGYEFTDEGMPLSSVLDGLGDVIVEENELFRPLLTQGVFIQEGSFSSTVPPFDFAKYAEALPYRLAEIPDASALAVVARIASFLKASVPSTVPVNYLQPVHTSDGFSYCINNCNSAEIRKILDDYVLSSFISRTRPFIVEAQTNDEVMKLLNEVLGGDEYVDFALNDYSAMPVSAHFVDAAIKRTRQYIAIVQANTSHTSEELLTAEVVYSLLLRKYVSIEGT